MSTFIASYYRQLSADIKWKNIRLKPVLLAPRGRRTGLKKFVLILKIFLHFNIRGKLSVIKIWSVSKPYWKSKLPYLKRHIHVPVATLKKEILYLFDYHYLPIYDFMFTEIGQGKINQSSIICCFGNFVLCNLIIFREERLSWNLFYLPSSFPSLIWLQLYK